MSETDGLVVYPLEEEIDELVISLIDGCLQRLIDYSKFNREVLGYFVSTLYGRDLLLLGITTSTIGDSQGVPLNNSYFSLQNEFLRRAKREIPSLRTVLYHNHPRVDIAQLDPETVRFLERGIHDGIYDYLRDHGIEPSLKNVATEELTRHLSETDILPRFGHVSVLITDTFREDDNFSHVNAYRISPRRDPILDRLRVTSLESKGIGYIKTYIELRDKLDRIYWETYQDSGKL